MPSHPVSARCSNLRLYESNQEDGSQRGAAIKVYSDVNSHQKCRAPKMPGAQARHCAVERPEKKQMSRRSANATNVSGLGPALNLLFDRWGHVVAATDHRCRRHATLSQRARRMSVTQTRRFPASSGATSASGSAAGTAAATATCLSKSESRAGGNHHCNQGCFA